MASTWHHFGGKLIGPDQKLKLKENFNFNKVVVGKSNF
jgi:hypothetical protein